MLRKHFTLGKDVYIHQELTFKGSNVLNLALYLPRFSPNRPSSFGGDATTTGGGASGIFASTQPFPAEPPVPLWRKVAVPGALVLGAVGVLGTYHAASRSAGTSTLNSSGDSGGMAYTSNSAAIGGAERADEGGGNAAQENADYTDASFAAPQRLEDGAAYSPFVGGTAVFPRSVGDLPAAGDSSILAGEFRRLTETMEQQTGHLVEAVSAMKALASRAEQDSSSLLAARVSSHTSELRAELGTIKQLLLLQAGGGGGGGGDKGTVATAGVAGAERVDIQVPSDRSKDSGIGESTSMSGDGDAKGGRGVEMASGGEAGRVPVAPLSEKEEQEKAREGAYICNTWVRRRDMALKRKSTVGAFCRDFFCKGVLADMRFIALSKLTVVKAAVA